MSQQYASKTTVSPEKTQIDIKLVLKKYGATAFAYGEIAQRAGLQFEMKGRRYRLGITFPDRRRFSNQAKYDQEVRSLWRSLFLVIKAKLIAVDTGIQSLEEAFLSDLVLPNGQTIGEHLIPQIAQVYEHHEMPPLLPGATKDETS